MLGELTKRKQRMATNLFHFSNCHFCTYRAVEARAQVGICEVIIERFTDAMDKLCQNS